MEQIKKILLTISLVSLAHISYAGNLFFSTPYGACKDGNKYAQCGSFGSISGEYDLEDKEFFGENQYIDWDVAFSFALIKTTDYNSRPSYHFWVQSIGKGLGMTCPNRYSAGWGHYVMSCLVSYKLKTSISHNGETHVANWSPKSTPEGISTSVSYGLSASVDSGGTLSGGVNASTSNSKTHQPRLLRSDYRKPTTGKVNFEIDYSPNLDWHYYTPLTDWSGIEYVRNVPLDVNNLYTLKYLDPDDPLFSTFSFDYQIEKFRFGLYTGDMWSTSYGRTEYLVPDVESQLNRPGNFVTLRAF